jgi:hypothetical protein
VERVAQAEDHPSRRELLVLWRVEAGAGSLMQPNLFIKYDKKSAVVEMRKQFWFQKAYKSFKSGLLNEAYRFPAPYHGTSRAAPRSTSSLFGAIKDSRKRRVH